MTDEQQKEPQLHQQQPYDSTLKSLLEDQAREMISVLLEEAVYLQELGGEALKPPLRADRVYLINYRGKLYILHIELETRADSEMPYRLLEYYGILHRKYKKPIISMVLYPFRTSLPESPLRVMSGDEELLVFHFSVIAFWKLQAREYLKKHAVSMYALLPTMDGAYYEVLSQALEEMKEWYVGQERRFAAHLLWFGTFLRRTDTVSPEDKRRIMQKMDKFDSLLEENPFVQKKAAEAEEKGRAEGRVEGRAEGLVEGEAKGKAEGLQKAVVTVIEGRFPPLAELAQQKVTEITDPELLGVLLRQAVSVSDEATAHWLLNTFAA